MYVRINASSLNKSKPIPRPLSRALSSFICIYLYIFRVFCFFYFLFFFFLFFFPRTPFSRSLFISPSSTEEPSYLKFSSENDLWRWASRPYSSPRVSEAYILISTSLGSVVCIILWINFIYILPLILDSAWIIFYSPRVHDIYRSFDIATKWWKRI